MVYAAISRWIFGDGASNHVIPLGLVSLLTVICLIAYRTSRFKLPPGAQPLPGPRSWPIIGSVPAIMWYFKHYGHRAFTEMYSQYGAVYGLNLPAGQRIVVLNDRSTIREAFVTQSSRMTNRRVPGLIKVSFPVQGSLVWENGEIWATRRRFIMGAFRKLGFTKNGILGQRIQDEAKPLCASFEKHGGLPFNPRRLLENATSNLICAIILGERFEYDDPTFCSLVNNSNIILNNLSLVSIGNFLPFLYNTPVCREYREAVNGLTEFIQGHVELHKGSYNANEPRDVIDLYLAEGRRREQKGEGIKFEEEDVWRSMLDILIAGFSSTATHLLWTLLFVTQNHDVQERIHKEIDSTIGDERLPSLDDRKLLPFTEATLCETHRCRMGTVTVPHVASEDAIVGGCLIPKGSQVLANLWSLHHNPLEWDEPDKFNPCRFLSKDGTALVLPADFMPFGVGPRMCPGEQFNKHESLLLFASIMQKYRLIIPEGDPVPDMEGEICGPAVLPGNIRICAIKR